MLGWWPKNVSRWKKNQDVLGQLPEERKCITKCLGPGGFSGTA